MMPVLEPVAASGVPTTLLGAMAIAVTALTGAVIFLFRYLMRKDEEMTKERTKHAEDRAQWAALRTHLETFEHKLRAEYETRHREIMTDHSEGLVKLYDEARQTDKENRREYLTSLDETRREYAANVDGVAKKYEEGAAKLGNVIDKLAARISGRARTH